MFKKINIFSFWLISLSISICAIILIGGYTRISDSGLSITEWLPISGVFYPLTEAQWQIEFNKYKMIDEFVLVNSSMTLSEFKIIFFWEWFHRIFARLIGVLYILPFLYFLIKNQIPRKYLIKIIVIGILLIMQAVIGWYMVKSGLVGRVDVSQYRLAMHLTMAFIILGLTFQVLLENNIKYFNKINFTLQKNLEILFFILLSLIFIQISYGAFVSGTHSGLIYNTWPTYNGKLLPTIDNNALRGIINFFEKGEYIIFIHRTFAILILLFVFFINIIFYKNNYSFGNSYLLTIFNVAFVIQIILGILMTYQNIPWHLALIHQGNAIILFLSSITMWVFSKKSLLEKLNS